MQAGGVPVQADGVPGQAGGVPVQADGVPVQAGGVPVQAGGVSVQAGRVPLQTVHTYKVPVVDMPGSQGKVVGLVVELADNSANCMVMVDRLVSFH